MKNILLVFLILPSLSIGKVLACGTWVLQEVPSGQSIRFYISDVGLMGAKGNTVMRAHRDDAFFIQGDRLRLKDQQMILSKLTGQKNGKRNYISQELGSFKDSILKLNTGAEYQIAFSKEKSSKIEVTQNNKIVAQGSLTPEFQKCQKEMQTQIFRVAFYFVWKSLKIDPTLKPAENWWW